MLPTKARPKSNNWYNSVMRFLKNYLMLQVHAYFSNDICLNHHQIIQGCSQALDEQGTTSSC
jgi:hypothetical protein